MIVSTEAPFWLHVSKSDAFGSLGCVIIAARAVPFLSAILNMKGWNIVACIELNEHNMAAKVFLFDGIAT